MPRKYTDEELDWLAEHARRMTWSELTPLFKERFGYSLTANTIAKLCSRRGVSTGRTGRFERGNTPWNRGMKGLAYGQKTWFKPGNRPYKWCPVGTEAPRKQDGYLMVKVAEPNVWRPSHHIVWEEHNGPVPKGCVIIFADNDKRNFDPRNLLCVTRAELGRINLRRLCAARNPDLTRAGVALARLQGRIAERLKEAKS